MKSLSICVCVCLCTFTFDAPLNKANLPLRVTHCDIQQDSVAKPELYL